VIEPQRPQRAQREKEKGKEREGIERELYLV